ncbi:MAG: hypothetical protein LUC83_09060 [Clostridiales bacterium]|nr:hypothetical protein [Clostridiales bacterium]
MQYKCVNDLDKFDFHEASLDALDLEGDVLCAILSSGIAKYNNPCNTKYVDCYIAETQIRMKNPRITRFFLEGAKYYDANDVLLEEVPDQEIPPEEYEATMQKLVSGEVFTLCKKDSGSDGNGGCCEIAVDAEDDTYWMEIEYEKIILEWDRFRNEVED